MNLRVRRVPDLDPARRDLASVPALLALPRGDFDEPDQPARLVRPVLPKVVLEAVRRRPHCLAELVVAALGRLNHFGEAVAHGRAPGLAAVRRIDRDVDGEHAVRRAPAEQLGHGARVGRLQRVRARIIPRGRAAFPPGTRRRHHRSRLATRAAGALVRRPNRQMRPASHRATGPRGPLAEGTRPRSGI